MVDAFADATMRGPGEALRASGREYSIADEARSMCTNGLLDGEAMADPVLRGGAPGSVV